MKAKCVGAMVEQRRAVLRCSCEGRDCGAWREWLGAGLRWQGTKRRRAGLRWQGGCGGERDCSGRARSGSGRDCAGRAGAAVGGTALAGRVRRRAGLRELWTSGRC
ncbi:hypothetical protein [Paenibacillus sp. FSL M7-0896]|uniref:hypothetical protein n=1 Tax=Paenibacillus sp. FSL M7-0896 TaxID=2921610 RepID=UPI0030DB6681